VVATITALTADRLVAMIHERGQTADSPLFIGRRGARLDSRYGTRSMASLAAQRFQYGPPTGLSACALDGDTPSGSLLIVMRAVPHRYLRKTTSRHRPQDPYRAKHTNQWNSWGEVKADRKSPCSGRV